MTEAVERLASASGPEERGAVYTKREVVDFILDLVGYEADRPLTTYRILEPSFGDGDFIHPILDRLLAAAPGNGGGWRGIEYGGNGPGHGRGMPAAVCGTAARA